ncbi:unnamed protein product [Caenorhabditis brenneri]
MDAQPVNPEREFFNRVLPTFWKHLILVHMIAFLFAYFGAHTVNFGMLFSWSMGYIVGESEHHFFPVSSKILCVSLSSVVVSILIALNSFVRMMDVIYGTAEGSMMGQLTGYATLTSLMIIYHKLYQAPQ